MSEELPPPPRKLTPLEDDDIRRLHSGAILTRVYFAAGDFPGSWKNTRTFGPTRSRFDHHQPSPRQESDRGAAISYWTFVATVTGSRTDALTTALAEAFQETRTVDLNMDEPALATMCVSRELLLLDVSDSAWVAKNGANAALTSGPRDRSQEWARLIHKSYPDLDGIWYASSVLPSGRCIALSERANDAFPARAELERGVGRDHLGDRTRSPRVRNSNDP